MACRTPLLDGFIEQCDHCHALRAHWHSCRDRHCPKCQYERSLTWTEKRMGELLPVPYFHVVFTIPDVLHKICLANQKVVYNLLLKCVQDTLLTIIGDPKHLGGRPGCIAVLHTWTQLLTYHPHVHCIVTGGGLSPDKTHWVTGKKSDDFLVPIEVLADLFKGEFLALLKGIPEVRANPVFSQAIQDAYKIKRWHLYAKKPFSGPETALQYLGQYTHRVAISNTRIIDFDDHSVTFQYRDRADENKVKITTIPVFEFIQRFFLHILPFRQVKIRHFGLLANRNKLETIQLVRQILQVSNDFSSPIHWKDLLKSKMPEDLFKCPHCRIGSMQKLAISVRDFNICRGP